MRATASRYALFLWAALATAQETRQLIVPSSGTSSFPACGVSCAALLQAQTNCQPSASTQLNFENCFCQEPSIAALYGTPDALCTAECPTQSDRRLLQTWYGSFCQQVGQGIDPLTVAPSSTAMVTVTSTNAAVPSPTFTAIAPNAVNNPDEGSWISGHWQWILMIAILAIGFGLIAWGAVWWRKRHEQKLDRQRAAMSGFPTEAEKRDGARAATPDLWGPHQHMHATKGWEYQQQASTAPGSSRDPEKHENGRSRSRREHGQGLRAEALRDSTVEQQPGVAGRRSSKGKQRASEGLQERDPSRQRSRSHRRRDRDNG